MEVEHQVAARRRRGLNRCERRANIGFAEIEHDALQRCIVAEVQLSGLNVKYQDQGDERQRQWNQAMQSYPIKIVAIAALMISGAGASYAEEDPDHDGPRDEDTAFLSAAISLGDGVRAAEDFADGKTMSGKFENEDGNWIYAIELLMPDNSELEVVVDPKTGTILETEEEDD